MDSFIARSLRIRRYCFAGILRLRAAANKWVPAKSGLRYRHFDGARSFSENRYPLFGIHALGEVGQRGVEQ
jgi:hypothetical protein